jgi:hypothetical protein
MKHAILFYIARLGFCLIIVSLVSSCNRSDESKLVGTWTIPIGDAKTYITYKPDHTCIMTTEGYGEPITTTGPWHLEGHEIVIGSKDPKVRDRIVKVTDAELEIFDASQNRVFAYRRVK